ncbi:MAG: hypothetical protein LUF92_02165 [Clostridiales bacterium]|nr:hypothetical protein [Clostridiales bacterium]
MKFIKGKPDKSGYIRKQDVINLIDSKLVGDGWGTDDDYFIGAHGLVDEIYDMPATDVEPVRHGSWIEDDYGFYSCSECGFEWDESEHTMDYCPSCGAKNGQIFPKIEEESE